MIEVLPPENNRAKPYKAAYTQVAKTGHSFGSALAIAISFTTHQSILWAIIHGFFSWFYVIYFALTR
jgi:hypothetical protein